MQHAVGRAVCGLYLLTQLIWEIHKESNTFVRHEKLGLVVGLYLTSHIVGIQGIDVYDVSSPPAYKTLKYVKL